MSTFVGRNEAPAVKTAAKDKDAGSKAKSKTAKGKE